MPIYEYQCQVCGARFDKLVRSIQTPMTVQCPQCGSQDCRKALSLFGTTGSSSTGSSAGAGASCAPSG